MTTHLLNLNHGKVDQICAFVSQRFLEIITTTTSLHEAAFHNDLLHVHQSSNEIQTSINEFKHLSKRSCHMMLMFVAYLPLCQFYT